MPGPKPLAINLNDVERQGLELLVRRYTTGQQKVIRARIVLLAARGENNREIASQKLRTPPQAAGHVRAVCNQRKSSKFICV